MKEKVLIFDTGIVKGKGRGLPQEAWTGPRGSR